MELQTKFIRSQLNIFKPFVVGCSLETARKGQDKFGELMATIHKGDVTVEDRKFGLFDAAMIKPKDEILGGVILYLHGGGYTCGDLSYAKGFGTVLAVKCGIKVFCPAYRLAPENAFPAALDDALEAYRYLLSRGFVPGDIILCGESSGGGLIYSLCLKLKSLGMTMPAGLIAISPWTDLTMSGASFEKNRDIDPSMTKDRLEFFAGCYVHGDTAGIADKGKDRLMKSEPLVSPLFGDLTSLPPSLIFVGGDEVMLDDSRLMYDRLLSYGCRAQIVVTPEMWHAYVLYCLKENQSDFDTVNKFLGDRLVRKKKLRWMRLDNAAKIYPAAKTRDWSNLFRLSATLTDRIDRAVLKNALDITVRRFPSIAVRLRRGVFWYYLEEIPKAPELTEERCFPLTKMSFDDIRKCAFRVIVWENRVAVEFFHAITDGNGGLVFLKTLVAEYLTEKYGVQIPVGLGILDRLAEPDEEELEDSFLKHSGPVTASRKESTAYHLNGSSESDSFCTVTVMTADSAKVSALAKKFGVTVTSLLTAALMKATIDIQNEKVRNPKHRKPVKILVPVNLRNLFPSKTLRNFVLYTTPGVDVRLGDYSVEELCRVVHHHLGTEITAKQMSTKIATNVSTEQLMILKLMPLFIKNIAMRAVFNAVGEKKSCFTMSNLGVIQMPDEMRRYVTRMDFILSVQSRAPYNCGVLTYGDTLYINFIRNINEPLLEYHFYKVMRSLGISIKAESNQRR